MSDLSPVFNKAVEHVVTICSGTLERLELSQTSLTTTLQELEFRLSKISEISQRLNDNRMTEACQSILIYKSKIERIKQKLSSLRSRIAGIETKISIKSSNL